jgi:predicted nucleotidyltransferase
VARIRCHAVRYSEAELSGLGARVDNPWHKEDEFPLKYASGILRKIRKGLRKGRRLPGEDDMDRRAILEVLSSEAPGLRKRYGVKTLAVFGSMARGDDREQSDVDILVTFSGKATFDNFMGLKLELEDLLGRPVDLGTPETLRPEMRDAVERDLIHVP